MPNYPTIVEQMAAYNQARDAERKQLDPLTEQEIIALVGTHPALLDQARKAAREVAEERRNW